MEGLRIRHWVTTRHQPGRLSFDRTPASTNRVRQQSGRSMVSIGRQSASMLRRGYAKRRFPSLDMPAKRVDHHPRSRTGPNIARFRAETFRRTPFPQRRDRIVTAAAVWCQILCQNSRIAGNILGGRSGIERMTPIRLPKPSSAWLPPPSQLGIDLKQGPAFHIDAFVAGVEVCLLEKRA